MLWGGTVSLGTSRVQNLYLLSDVDVQMWVACGYTLKRKEEAGVPNSGNLRMIQEESNGSPTP